MRRREFSSLVPADGRAGASSVTLVESNVAERIASLEKLGIKVVARTESEQISLAIIRDPDGNQIVFAQGRGEKHRAVS